MSIWLDNALNNGFDSDAMEAEVVHSIKGGNTEVIVAIVTRLGYNWLNPIRIMALKVLAGNVMFPFTACVEACVEEFLLSDDAELQFTALSCLTEVSDGLRDRLASRVEALFESSDADVVRAAKSFATSLR